jgi:transposase
MSRSVKVSKKFKEFEFLDYYKIHRSKPYIYRCLACHYIQIGHTYDEVAKMLHYSRNSIMKWVERFEQEGVKALLETKAGRGRVAKISSKLSTEFSEAVISLQENRNGGRIIGKDIVDMAQEKYAVTYSVSGIYKLLSRMGLSWVSARSIHPKADLEAQETFKKTLNKM